MSGAEGLLRALSARLRRLGRLPAELAKEAAPDVEAAIRATAAAGTTPDGVAWAPRKTDGGRALANAAQAVTAKADGASVRVTVRGIEARHHLGRVRGGVKRQILPDGGAGIPDKIGAVCVAAAKRAFARIMGGAA